MMTGVVESYRHKYIYLKIRFLMETKRLWPFVIKIRIAHPKCAVCFPLSFSWSNILSIVISLQGGKVAKVRPGSCRLLNAEHVSLIQIHDHISFMALQL